MPSARITDPSSNVSLLEDEFDQSVVQLLEEVSNLQADYSTSIKIKNLVSNMYSVFVQTLGKTSEQQNALLKSDAIIKHLTSKGKDAQVCEETAQKDLRDQLAVAQRLCALNPDSLSVDAAESLVEAVKNIHMQMEDNASWQARLHRYGEENELLHDEVADLRATLSDTQFSNQSLKSELCGRIQQLQLMSKGMATNDDKVYKKILAEMEQNSMKAFAHHNSQQKRASLHQPEDRSLPVQQGQMRAPSKPAQSRSPGAAAASPQQQTALPQATPSPSHRSPAVSPHKPSAAATLDPGADGRDTAAAPLDAERTQVWDPRSRFPEHIHARTVVLHKDAEGSLGLTISGGVVEGMPHPVTIQKMQAGKPAAECGCLFTGDIVVKANGNVLRSLPKLLSRVPVPMSFTAWPLVGMATTVAHTRGSCASSVFSVPRTVPLDMATWSICSERRVQR
eukprot:m.553639 g.553639  ORF g.553639 m.553639 type:complete len:451 (-) comp22171_c0_seq7:1555-2907(-)